MAYRFEDLVPGRAFDAGSRVVSAADIAAFADLSGDRNAIHMDMDGAAAGPFAGPIAHGALGIAIGTGLVSQAGITAGVLVALVEARWRFIAPVRPGDTLSARVTVAERRDTTRADRGLVRFVVELTNQHGQLVQGGELTELIAR